MTKEKKILIAAVVFFLVALAGIKVFADGREGNAQNGIVSDWGEYLSSVFYQKSNARGTAQNEQRLEQAIKFYELKGYENKEAEEMAKQYIKEADALYNKAVEAGYQVTEEEVAEHVNQIKEVYHSDTLNEESRKQMETMINCFESEEDYWEYEREVYKTLLVTQNYVDALQEEFWKENPNAAYEDWGEYLEEFKASLVGE